jgi:acylphosphatase
VDQRVRRRVVVHGRVQGVFFRDSVRERARAHGVAGWVRNTPEGTVEIHAEGDPDAVEHLLRFARTGPRAAEVDRVEVSDVPVEGHRGFDVR